MAIGETLPRRLWCACALGLLMPGLGHLYCGEVRLGLSIWGATLAIVALAFTLWTQWLFVPWLAGFVLVLAWTSLQLWMFADRRRFVARAGADFRLGPGNHWLTYLAVFLGLGVLPTTVGGYAVSRKVGSVAVSSEAMFPALLPGDRLLVDRDAFSETPPAVGELVVLSGRRGAHVARVVATAGHTVHLRDGRPVIDGEPPVQRAVQALRVPLFDREAANKLTRLQGYREQRGGRAYVVTYDPVERRIDPAPVRVGEREIYVLGDNRDAAVQAEAFGRVELAAVTGRPRAVWLSIDGQGEPRAGRVGVEVR